MIDRKPPIRTLMIVLAAGFAVAIPILQAVTHFGMSAAAFAAQGDETLRAAPYAFSIWGLIYLGMIAFAIYQATPMARETPALRALGWPSVVGMAGCGLWIVASALDLRAATVTIILISAVTLIAGLSKARDTRPAPREGWLIVWPLALLAGWLTVASAINVATVLTAKGLIDPHPVWALAGICAVLFVGGAVGWRLRLWIYPVPIAWGLAAVYAAHAGESSATAWTAAGAAALLAAEALVLLARRPA